MQDNQIQQVRNDQKAAGKQMEGPVRPIQKPVLKPAPHGHEAYLKALETSGAVVSFEKCSSGEKIVGKIRSSDEYSVSVRVFDGSGLDYVTRVLFKHDISEFSAIRTAADTSTLLK